MGKQHNYGDLVRVMCEFTDMSSLPQDPSVVKLTFQDPSANETTYVYGTNAELVRDGKGKYYVDLDIDEVGIWTYRWWSTGAGQASKEATFRVPAVTIT